MTDRMEKNRIASVTFGSPCSLDLSDDKLVVHFLGMIPIIKIHLGAVHYLRLATRSEVSPLYFLMNWPQILLSSHRSICPVYILQTRKGKKVFLKLQGGAHFRLRKAIAKHSERKTQRAA